MLIKGAIAEYPAQVSVSFEEREILLHTRARKYNIRALGTYFECEGVKRTYLNFS